MINHSSNDCQLLYKNIIHLYINEYMHAIKITDRDHEFEGEEGCL